MSTESDKLTSQEYWINSYGQPRFEYSKNHDISKLLLKYLPKNAQGRCIEIGSFPGSYLAVVGTMGYELNGIDFHPLNISALPDWLLDQGFKTGHFSNEDFFAIKGYNNFDVVMSFGFIEHFKNYKEVILNHTTFVKNGGYLIITTPNFRGWIQYLLHSIFDKKNLQRHNIQSMNPFKWKNILEENGFEILYHGYFGNFWFWADLGDERGRFNKFALKQTMRIVKVLRKILFFNSVSFSAYCGIVARLKTPKLSN